MDLSTFKDTTQTPPPTPGEEEKATEINKVASKALLTDAVTKLANVPNKGQDPATPPPSPSYLARGDSTDTAAFYPLTNSGSTDSAVEATEEVLETLEGRTKADKGEVNELLTSRTNDEEKENICEVDPNVEMEPICDRDCECEKRSDLSSSTPVAPLLIDEVADRRNLAEIKIQ